MCIYRPLEKNGWNKSMLIGGLYVRNIAGAGGTAKSGFQGQRNRKALYYI
ncbi:hypothetical protein MNV_270007 [Candidatus Methanoperedens nitroreducens]|uniref:Uncharacterized protein n=1 Tax=Candidatus Methanoperedens nitratireducens TaxID=1392998 RepID=A0A284VPQ3_9EURY|nr:hypothetical protein MNV_270007 [Candidatus Methanoperedens nitroreducens]